MNNSISNNASSISVNASSIASLSNSITSMTSRISTLESVSFSFNKVYPIGSIYMSVNSTNPSTLFGGTWIQLKDRFLLGAGSTYTNGETGGEATHTLTISEMPSHNHTVKMDKPNTNTSQFTRVGATDRDTVNGRYHDTNYTGGNQPHNNMPPYLVVYMWKRTS